MKKVNVALSRLSGKSAAKSVEFFVASSHFLFLKLYTKRVEEQVDAPDVHERMREGVERQVEEMRAPARNEVELPFSPPKTYKFSPF